MRSGEERDFRAFVDRSVPLLRSLAGALAGPPPAATELLDGVLTTLARRWHRLERDPARYAIRLLYRAYAGRRTPVAALTFRRAPEIAAAVGSRGAAGAGAAADAGLGHTALGQLPPRSRALLVLRYFEAHGDAEAAAIMGTSASAVAGELTAALEQLHAAWERVAGGELPASFDLEAEAAAIFRELAEASTNDPTAPSAGELATAALASGVRSNRLRVGMGVGVGAAAAVSLVLAASLVANGVTQPGGDQEQFLSLELNGHSVVSRYFEGEHYYVLDPRTGEYHRWAGLPGAAAPDLRSAASVRAFSTRTEVRVWSVPEREELMRAEVPGVARTAVWSPDGARLAVAVAEFEAHWFSELAVIETATGEVDMIDLQLPSDRAATWYASGEGVTWLDPARLAVPLSEAGRLLSRGDSFGAVPPVEAIGIFDRRGALIEEVPIDTTPLESSAAPHGDTGWSPHGFLSDGRCLFSRRPEAGTIYLTAQPLVPDPEPYESIGVTLPEPAQPVTVWSTYVLGWFGTTAVIVASVQPDYSHPDFEPVNDFEGESRTYFADFRADSLGMEQVDLAEVLPLPEGVQHPGGFEFADATALSPAASWLAFTR